MPHLPDYEAWALFAAVADQGSFRAAATATGTSVPTVSKAVARLERRLGVALFHRTSRRVSLTSAGAELTAHARAIVSSGAEAEEAARAGAGALAGPIRMTAPMSLGLICLGAPLAAFLADHPGVTIDVVLSDAQCDLVGEGIDLALRIAAMHDSSLLAQAIAPVDLMIVTSPTYLAAAGMPAHPRDLSQHRVLGYGHLNRAQPVVLIGPEGDRVTVTPTGPLFTNNGELMVPLLVGGQGIALLPSFIAGEALADGRLQRLFADWSTPPASLYLVTPPSRLRPARVKALATLLVAHLKESPLFAPSLGGIAQGLVKN